jgi:hypothetical protein
MDLSILTWLKHSKPMHSMPLSMPLSWTESLDHLEHVMGPLAGPHHIPEDIPNKLPPLKGIEHQMDFVPGASIPNHPTY